MFPTPLDAYPPAADGLFAVLSQRVAVDPFNAVATAVFLLAIIHTFAAARIAALAHRIQDRHDARLHTEGRPRMLSVRAEFLHLFGEVEVVFGLSAAVLLIAIAVTAGWDTAKRSRSCTLVPEERAAGGRNRAS